MIVSTESRLILGSSAATAVMIRPISAFENGSRILNATLLIRRLQIYYLKTHSYLNADKLYAVSHC